MRSEDDDDEAPWVECGIVFAMAHDDVFARGGEDDALTGAEGGAGFDAVDAIPSEGGIGIFEDEHLFIDPVAVKCDAFFGL